MTEDIVFTREKHVGLVTLQRVQALNALTLPMILALQQQLEAWLLDPDIHAVVIQAAPGRAFCAGGDVRWLYEAGLENNPEQMQFFWHEYRLNHFIHQFKKPYIAMMDGVTMGGGVGLSLHGSHPVASERFLFAMPETGIGFFPDIGASYLLSRCKGYLGVYLGLTGHRLSAVDAHGLGLVKALIPSTHFPQVLERLVDADLSKQAHEAVDACLHPYKMKAEAAPILAFQEAVDACFQYHEMELIMDALSRSHDDWHALVFDNLSAKAPLSLKVTLAQIQKAKSMSLDACLKMDYCLVGHFMQEADFYEGVRALLVDKDKSPHWQPSTLSEVSHAKVADYFQCRASALSF